MFTNSPNENVSQQYFHLTHIVSWFVIPLQILLPKMCGRLTEQMPLLVLFGNYIHLKSSAQKAKHNLKLFILEMKHIMVPLVNLVNTVNKLFSQKNRLVFIIILTFFLLLVSFFSLFHVVSCCVPVWIL